MANNQGGVYDVSIVSGDGRGLVGLDLAYTDEQGPMLVRNVSVKGFDVGVATAHALASVTMENVTVEQQNVAGLRNDGQPLSVRKLVSVNRVPAVVNNAGLLVLARQRPAHARTAKASPAPPCATPPGCSCATSQQAATRPRCGTR